MQNFNSQFSGSGNASASSGTVIIGPIKVDSGCCDVALVAKASSGTNTTPTNPKLQYSPDESASVWVDVASGSVTPPTTANATAETTKTGIVCKHIRVVAARAFAAGNATIYLLGVEKG